MSNFDFSKLPDDKELAKKIIDNESQADKERRNNGFLGKIFGHKDSAPFYITGIVLISLVLFLIFYMFLGNDTETTTKKDVMTAILPVITSIIGFFFGQKEKSKSDI